MRFLHNVAAAGHAVRDPSSSPADLPTPGLRRELAAAAVLVAFGLYIVSVGRRVPLGVATDPLGPRFFPVTLGAGIALCGLLLAGGVVLFRRRGRALRMPGEPEDDDDAVGAFSVGRLVSVIVVTAAYLAAFQRLGYLLSTPLYILVIMLLHGGAPPRSLAITPVLITVVLYAVFKYGLRIPVPDGILEPLLRRGG